MAGERTAGRSGAASRAPGVRRRRRSPEEIRERLLVAAREVFKRSGYAGARTAAIARRADVTEAQLFRYYDSKADLFRDAVFEPLNRHFSEFNARHLSQADEALEHRDIERLYISELQQFLNEHAGLLLSLVVADTYSADQTRGVAGIDSLRSYFERGAAMMSDRTGEKSGVDPRLMVRVSFAAVLGNVLFRHWLFSGVSADHDDVDRAIMEFVLDGLNATTRPGQSPPPGAAGGKGQ